MHIVRIFMAESDARLNTIIDYLKETAHIRGVTVFRAISGYGSSGSMHSANLLYMSMDLPIVVEFFDKEEKITPAIEHFKTLLGSGHILTWSVNVI